VYAFDLESQYEFKQRRRPAMAGERRVLDLGRIGIPEVPVFGRYEYASAHSGLRTHTHPGAVEICYLERGLQTYRAGGREYHLVGGDLFVTAPGEPHDTAQQPEDRGILYWLNLRVPRRGASWLMLPARQGTILAGKLSNLPVRQFAGKPVLKRIFDEIFALYDRPGHPLKRVDVANQLVRCLLEVMSCAGRHGELHCSPVIARVVERIQSCPEERYSLNDLAGEAGLSLSRFKVRFKAEMGIAPHEYILRCKMEAAKKILRDGQATVTEAAMRLEFSSSQYFATVFKRFTKQTPQEFRVEGPKVPLRPGRA
jgi:AraC-like DNA-binding protein